MWVRLEPILCRDSVPSYEWRGSGWSSDLWKDLQKGVDLHALKNAFPDVWICLDESLNFLHRIGLHDDQATRLVRKRAGQYDSSLGIQGFQVREMGRTVDFALGLTIWAVVA